MGSVFKVIEIVGTSSGSCGDATRTAITTAGRTLRDLRVAEVVRQDMTIRGDGQPDEFRIRLSVSFKYEDG
jgi:flavin-binding protein dodecin